MQNEFCHGPYSIAQLTSMQQIQPPAGANWTTTILSSDHCIAFNVTTNDGKALQRVILSNLTRLPTIKNIAKDVVISSEYIFYIEENAVRITDNLDKPHKTYTFTSQIIISKLFDQKRLLVVTTESIFLVDPQEADHKSICKRSDQIGMIRDIGITDSLTNAYIFGVNRNNEIGASIYVTQDGKSDFCACHLLSTAYFYTLMGNPTNEVMILLTSNPRNPNALTIKHNAKGSNNSSSIDVPITPGDVPMYIHPIPSMGMYIIITKFLNLKLIESIGSAKELLSVSLKQYFQQFTIEKYAPCTIEQHCFILALSNQMIFKIGFNTKIMAQFLSSIDPSILSRVSLTFSLPFNDCDKIVKKVLSDRFIAKKDFKGMAEFAAAAYSPYLHSEDFLNNLQSIGGNSDTLITFLNKRLTVGELNSVESVFYTGLIANSKISLGANVQPVQHCFQLMKIKKLVSSPQAIFQLLQLNPPAVLEMLTNVATSEMIFSELMSKGHMDLAITFAKERQIPLNLNHIFIQQIKSQNIQQALSLMVNAKNNGQDFDVSSALQTIMSIPNIDLFLLAKTITLINDADKAIDGIVQTNIMKQIFPIQPAFKCLIGVFTKYDKQMLANICQDQQRFDEAFMLHQGIYQKMTVVNFLKPPFNWMIDYLSQFTPEVCFEYMDELMKHNPEMFKDTVIAMAQDFHDAIGMDKIVEIFKRHSEEALFSFLKVMHTVTESNKVHEDYIQVCINLRKQKELISVLESSTSYRAENVKSMLTVANLVDDSPMLIVCCKYNMLLDLVEYLDGKRRLNCLNYVLTDGKSDMLPKFVAVLCDMNKEDNCIIELMYNGPLPFSFRDLFDVLHERQRISLMQRVIDKYMNFSLQSVPSEFFTVAAIFYVETNEGLARKFLLENRNYNPKEVGDYCKTSHPSLALEAYSMSSELVENYFLTATEYQMFSELVIFLFRKKCDTLWNRVMDPDYQYRTNLIDQLKNINFCKLELEGDVVNVLLNVLVGKNMYSELIDILSGILSGSSTGQLRFAVNLQELIISCAIKDKHPKLRNFITQYNDYDPTKIGLVAETYGAFEDAVIIYKNKGLDIDVVRILADKLDQVDRAIQHSQTIDKKEVWLELARIQLVKGMINECITSYLRAGEYPNYQKVIEAANNYGDFENLMRYLESLRMTISNDPDIDNEYAMCLVKSEQLKPLEGLLSGKSGINAIKLGDRCYDQKFFEGARLFFSHIKNFPKLAMTYVKLELYSEALDCATRASQPQVWREVCQSCVNANKLELAFSCAANLVCSVRELPTLVKFYEHRGLFDEIIRILEAAMSKENPTPQQVTILGLIYCRYEPNKLNEHISHRGTQIKYNELVSEVINAKMYLELAICYERMKSYDLAVRVMLDYPGIAWQDKLFVKIVQKSNNNDYLYRGIDFYAESHPDLLCDYLKSVSSRLDSIRTVKQLKKLNVIPICRGYLQTIQNLDQQLVNITINDLYIDEFDYQGLFASITTYKNFDTQELAKKLENHQLVEFRRVANTLYKDSRKFKESIFLAHQDGLVKDAIQHALDSKDPGLVNEVMEMYLKDKRSEAVIALLFVCYDIIDLDFVLELCWKYNQLDYAMPYLVQYMKENERRVTHLETKINLFESKMTELKETSRKTASKVETASNMQTLTTPLMISAASPISAPRMQQQQQQYGQMGGVPMQQQQQNPSFYGQQRMSQQHQQQPNQQQLQQQSNRYPPSGGYSQSGSMGSSPYNR